MAISKSRSLFRYFCERFRHNNFHDGMPRRNLDLVFQLDANQVNARGQNKSINRFESWHRDKVIFLEMSNIAYDEACVRSKQRRDKADNYTEMYNNGSWLGENEYYRLIEKILFPNGVRKQSDKNDIAIVLVAKLSYATLLTNDRKHILLNGDVLYSALGVRVMNPDEAVSEITKCIRFRDREAIRIAKETGRSLPKWVGKDIKLL